MSLEIKNEGDFEYIEVGKGPVLLLLHGLFGALSNWKTVVDHFSNHYKVIIPLMPVYKMPLLKTNVKGLSNFINKFIRFKKLNDLTLLGNSLGGHVALVYTLDHPEHVKNLILTGSSGLYENSLGGSFPKRNDREYIRNRVEYTFYDPKTATKELVDEVFGLINDRNSAVRIIKMAKSAIAHNLSKEIHKIKIPVCLIWGKQDNITPPHVAEEFHSSMPNSELNFIDKCGHAPMMETPLEFNQLLDTFLAKHNPA